MAQFEIIPFNGGNIRHLKDKQVVHWSVFIVNELLNRSIFLGSFFTKRRAEEFIEKIESDIERGDYSCLTLKN